LRIFLKTQIYPRQKSAPPGATAWLLQYFGLFWRLKPPLKHLYVSVFWRLKPTPEYPCADVFWRFGSEGDDWGMSVAGNTPTASILTKIGKIQSAGCRLCRIAREARGESTDILAAETHGHINSAGCKGMTTTITAAHHSIWRHLYDSLQAAQKPKNKLKFVTLDKQSSMSTLWRREEFLRFCSKKSWRRRHRI